MDEKLTDPDQIARVIADQWPETEVSARLVAGAAMHSLLLCLREGGLLNDAATGPCLTGLGVLSERDEHVYAIGDMTSPCGHSRVRAGDTYHVVARVDGDVKLMAHCGVYPEDNFISTLSTFGCTEHTPAARPSPEESPDA